MKQNVFFIFLVSAAILLVGCGRSPAATNENSAPVNLSAEIARAKAENKLLLLEFGSSDACPPCILFQREVFSKPEFLAYEKSNLVFVRLDFPFKTQLPPDVTATNNLLSRQFDIYQFPAFIALDREGKEFWRQEGITLQQLNPNEFISLIKSVKKKEK